MIKNTNRIYDSWNGETYIPNMGWVTYQEFRKSHKKFTQISPKYIDENLVEGTEDFSTERWNTKNLPCYYVTLRTYKEGRGQKQVADRIINLQYWEGQRKDIINILSQKYSDRIAQGYQISLEKMRG